MKSLVIDASSSCLSVSAKNDNAKATVSLDIGQKQSHKILPSIDYVLSQVDLSPKDLDYLSLTSGPGTFTGLRLAFSALKAISLACNVPIYAVPTLEALAFPYSTFAGLVVSVIDAKKDQFFAAIYENGKTISEAEDTTAPLIANRLSELTKNSNKKILVCGPDAKIFLSELQKADENLHLSAYDSEAVPTNAIFKMAEEMIRQKKEPLADYDGPVYLRKSEAEIKLESNS